MAGKKKLEVEITGDSKDALKAMGDIESKAGGLGSAMTAMGTLAVAGFAAVGAAAIGAGVALFDIGSQFDEAFDKIRVNTGKTGPLLDELKGSFNAVLSDTPADMNDVSDAVAVLNQQLGLTGPPLEDMARQILDLSHITGTDLNANLEGITSLFENWGVASEYQTGVLDLLFRTMQASGAPVATLSDALAENGTVLRELGFSIPEAAALFGTLAKAGLDAGDVMPAFSKAMASAAKNGVSAKDMLQQTFDTIKNAPNEIAASQAALEVFGAKAGPKLAAMIREGTLSFADMQAQIEGSSDTIGAAAADTKDWGEKFTIFKNQLMIALEPVATALFDSLGTAIDGLMPEINKLTQWFADNPQAISDFAASVKNAVQWVIDNVPGAVQSIIGFVQDFMAGVGQIQAWWDEHGEQVMSVVNFIIEGVKFYVSSILAAFDFIGWVISGAIDAWNWLWDKVEGFVNWVQYTAKPAIEDFATSVYLKFLEFKILVTAVWDTIWAKIESFIQNVQGIPQMISDAVYGAWDGLKEGFRNALNWIIDEWNGLKVPSFTILGKTIGGQELPDIQRLHSGGTFRAPSPGGEGLALLRDGERVSTPGSSGAVYVSVEPVSGAVMVETLTTHQRRGGATPWVQVA